MAELPLNLEFGLGAAHRKTHQRAAGQLRGLQDAGDIPGLSGTEDRQLSRPGETSPIPLAALLIESCGGPGAGLDSLHLETGLGAQRAAKDEQVAAAAQSGNEPKRRNIPGLEDQSQRCGPEGGLSLLDFQLNGGGTHPAQGGLLPEQGETFLEPLQGCLTLADVEVRAQGKPADHQKGHDDEEGKLWRHGRPLSREVKAQGLYDSTAGDEPNERVGEAGRCDVRRGWRLAVREFFYGLIGYEFERQALELRGELESAFMLITMGDMLGVPVIPPLYSLRILPFVVPHIATWKRRVLRERDLADKEEFHLHGV